MLRLVSLSHPRLGNITNSGKSNLPGKNMQAIASLIDILDIAAFVALFATYYLYDEVTNRVLGPDISTRMKVWRLRWAQQAQWREERITDVSLVRGLSASVSFFASTSIFIVSGLVAMLAASEPITVMLNQYPLGSVSTPEQFSFKIVALLLLAISAFFKFGWAMRLHSYSSLMVGAMPEPSERGSEDADDISMRLSEMSFLASKHFHGGMRAYYLGFAALTWFFSAWLFLATLVVVILVMLRRDYASRSFVLASKNPLKGRYKI